MKKTSSAPYRLLVVDDSAVARAVMRRALDFEVTGRRLDLVEADSGDRALQVALAGGVDLVVADLTMPGMDGLELARRLRASPDSGVADVPVVLISVMSPAAYRDEAETAGVDAILQKPIARSGLVETVERLLPRRGTTGPLTPVGDGGARP